MTEPWSPLDDDCPICGVLYKLPECPHTKHEVYPVLQSQGRWVPIWA